MPRRKFLSDFRSTSLYCTLSSSFFGLLCIVIILAIFALIITRVSVPEPIMAFMAGISLCSGAFISGYVCSRRRKQNGLMLGLICGCIVFCSVFLFGLIIARGLISFNFTSKLFMALIFGAIGGIVGVNSKKKRY